MDEAKVVVVVATVVEVGKLAEAASEPEPALGVAVVPALVVLGSAVDVVVVSVGNVEVAVVVSVVDDGNVDETVDTELELDVYEGVVVVVV